jgi:hypothetical protein
MKIRISPTHLISHSAGDGERSIGRAAKTASASLVDRSKASAPPTAIRLVEAKNAVPFCSEPMICMSTMRLSRSSRRRIQVSR